MPRPTSSIVSVAMNAGTRSRVTSTPLTTPIVAPTATARATAGPIPRSSLCGSKAKENTTAVRPSVDPTDRSKSLFAMTNVMPTAMTATRDESRSRACSASPEAKNVGLIAAPAANSTQSIASRPNSQVPANCPGRRPSGLSGEWVTMSRVSAVGRRQSGIGGSSNLDRDCRSPTPEARSSLVLEPLADLFNGLFGYQLRARVEVGGGDAAIDLQIELHHRPETLQERLLAERACQGAGTQRLLLRRAEIEAIRAHLAGVLRLRNGLGKRRREDVVAGESADHVAARFDQRDDAVNRIVHVSRNADTLWAGVDLEVGQLAGLLQRRNDSLVGGGDTVVHLDVAHGRVVGKDDGALRDAPLFEAVH